MREYGDVGRLEREVARLLLCEGSRAPAHTETAVYMRFRSSLLCAMADPGHASGGAWEEVRGAAGAFFLLRAYLPQGLTVTCKKASLEDDVGGGIQAVVAWDPGRFLPVVSGADGWVEGRKTGSGPLAEKKWGGKKMEGGPKGAKQEAVLWQ
jgi:hypothetical protein